MLGAIRRTFDRITGKDTGNQEPVSSAPRTPTNLKMHAAPTLQEKYPQIRSIAVNLTISSPDNETEPTLNGRSFGPESLSYFEFRCKNVECSEGGFDLAEIIGEAAEIGDPQRTGRMLCHGWHSKNKLRNIRCHYELNYRVNLNYNKN